MQRLVKIYQRLLPSPFTIAILLTVFTFFVALLMKPESEGWSDYILEISGYWEQGLWDPSKGGLYFAFQMMLMLVLGHVLALSKPVSLLIDKITTLCTDTASSALFISFFTILVSFFSWGLALIFGAILARKTGEKFAHSKVAVNYGLIGACGYVGLMTWHGGLSGSAPLKAAEKGNLKGMLPGVEGLPDQVPLSETVLSSSNLIVFTTLLIVIPVLMYLIGKKSEGRVPHLTVYNTQDDEEEKAKGAEKIDRSNIFGLLIGGLIVVFAIYKLIFSKSSNIIDPNFINLMLLGASLVLHQNFHRFQKAIGHAIGDSSGILIQFPLYFGIIGIMKSSGMIESLSSWFVLHSSSESFPFFTFLSAGIINVFVPSGGGQWVVQGPIIIQAAMKMNISFGKIIMALSYGDQLTNMLQPFWALPLLGITGLKAQRILPFTLILFLIGVIIYGLGIFIL